MTASKVDFGWEVMVTIIVALTVLSFVIIILILRTPRSHRLRVGMFVERDEAETETPQDVAVIESADTAEWPRRNP